MFVADTAKTGGNTCSKDAFQEPARSPRRHPDRAAAGLCPELNLTEYIWGHLKHHELANRGAGHFADLKTGARNRLRSMQLLPTLIRAFWHQAELPL
jgi:hypothetical protein